MWLGWRNTKIQQRGQVVLAQVIHGYKQLEIMENNSWSVRGSATDFPPQGFTSCHRHRLHWKPNQQQAELDTRPSGHEENPITSEIIRADCSWSVAPLSVCVVLDISTHGWELVTAYTLCGEEHYMSTLRQLGLVRRGEMKMSAQVVYG